MKFKNIIASLLFASFCFTGLSQFGGNLSKEDMSTKLANTKTLVALTGNDKFDENLKKGMEEFWDLTEFEFVSKVDAKKQSSEKGISIIMPLKITITDNTSTQTYPLLAFFLGGESKLGDYGYSKLLAYCPIDNFGREKQVTGASFRAKHFPQFIQQYIKLRVSGAIPESTSNTRYAAEKIYHERVSKTKGKIILIDKALLVKVNTGHLEKYITTEYKIVNKNELEEAINEGRENTCYLMPVFTRHKYVFVVDCKSGEILYNTYNIYGMTLKKDDIKNLGTTIK